jgi:hypothetical protein
LGVVETPTEVLDHRGRPGALSTTGWAGTGRGRRQRRRSCGANRLSKGQYWWHKANGKYGGNYKAGGAEARSPVSQFAILHLHDLLKAVGMHRSTTRVSAGSIAVKVVRHRSQGVPPGVHGQAHPARKMDLPQSRFIFRGRGVQLVPVPLAGVQYCQRPVYSAYRQPEVTTGSGRPMGLPSSSEV